MVNNPVRTGPLFRHFEFPPGKQTQDRKFPILPDSAPVFQHEKITQQSYTKLQEAPEDPEGRQWVPSELDDLFRKKREVCQKQSGEAE